MRFRALAAILLLVAMIAACEFDDPTPVVLGDDGGRNGWIITCPFSHSAQVDPIVNPGEQSGHMHDFFGNTSTNEHTTTNSLIFYSETTCQHVDDQAAYWTPSLYDEGEKVDVIGQSFYYLTDKVDPNTLTAIPTGLRMIAGDATATDNQPARTGHFEEHRNGTNNTRGESSLIDAPNGLVLRVNYPQCWDGVNLDSPDHQSHMAYARQGVCPSSHPVVFPQLVMFTRYDTDGGSDVTLASGPWFTYHADFWNAWHPDTFQWLLDNCTDRHCGRVHS